MTQQEEIKMLYTQVRNLKTRLRKREEEVRAVCRELSSYMVKLACSDVDGVG